MRMHHMSPKVVTALAAICLLSVLALPSCVSAVDHSIQPGDSYLIKVELSVFEIVTYSWDSSVPLTFTVEDSSGNLVTYLTETNATSGVGALPPPGTYTLKWQNNGASVAHLSFYVSDQFSEVEDAMSAFMWAMIIVGIIIVAVVVIIVIVVVMGGKTKHAQPPMGPPPQMATQAMVTGHCPTCGTQLDPNASFCSKCGTRYR